MIQLATKYPDYGFNKHVGYGTRAHIAAIYKYGLTDDQLFDSAESMLKAGKLADIMIIATPDRLHYQQAMDALKLDYHLLLEKPLSPAAQECRDIETLAIERNREVVGGHR